MQWNINQAIIYNNDSGNIVKKEKKGVLNANSQYISPQKA